MCDVQAHKIVLRACSLRVRTHKYSTDVYLCKNRVHLKYTTDTIEILVVFMPLMEINHTHTQALRFQILPINNIPRDGSRMVGGGVCNVFVYNEIL